MPFLGRGLKVSRSREKLWGDHLRQWSRCKRCPLCKRRTQVVLPRGKMPCDLLLIGEAPGESEDVLGRAFIGPAGYVLDGILREAFRRKNPPKICIDNVVACIPNQGDKGSVDTRPPKREEIRICRPRLQNIIRICEPKIIVTLGRVSASEISTEDLPSTGKKPRICGIIHPSAFLHLPPGKSVLARKRCVLYLRNLGL